MRKRYIIIILIIVIALYPIYFLPINRIINSFYPINKTCIVDEDCKMGWADCELCETYAKGAAINKDFQPFCPLPKPFKLKCPLEAPPWYYGFKAVCENNKCKEKSTNNVDGLMNDWLYKLL